MNSIYFVLDQPIYAEWKEYQQAGKHVVQQLFQVVECLSEQ